MGKRNGKYPGQWPRLDDGFLRDVAGGFARRRKALRYKGHRFAFGDDGEWFSVEADTCTRIIKLTFERRHRAHLYVRGGETGRILIRREDMRLINAPRRIVTAFETIIDVEFQDVGREAFACVLENAWSPLELRVLGGGEP